LCNSVVILNSCHRNVSITRIVNAFLLLYLNSANVFTYNR